MRSAGRQFQNRRWSTRKVQTWTDEEEKCRKERICVV